MALKTLKRPADVQGIKRLVWVDAKTLSDNPKNWRKHPARQMKALRASVVENGWAGALLYNETTKRLIDGHARKHLNGIVPVLIGSFTEAQERRILATLDPLSAMAETDDKMLRELLGNVDEELDQIIGEHKAILERTTRELEVFADDVTAGTTDTSLFPAFPIRKETPTEAMEDAPEEIREINEDIIFSASNKWQIPELLPAMLCHEYPTDTWAGPKEATNPGMYFDWPQRPFPDKFDGGFLGFYTDDYRFENVYTSAKTAFMDVISSHKWKGVMAPAFSMWWNWPLPVKLFNLYRTRWCLRFWQELGIRVIPDILWDDTELSFEYSINTLPKEVPVLATECRGIRRGGANWKNFINGVRKTLKIVKTEVLVIYGGVENKKEIDGKLPKGAKAPKYIYLESQMAKRQRLRNEGSY